MIWLLYHLLISTIMMIIVSFRQNLESVTASGSLEIPDLSNDTVSDETIARWVMTRVTRGHDPGHSWAVFPRVGGDHDDDDHIDNPATNSDAEEYYEEWSLNISFITTSPPMLANCSSFTSQIFLKPKYFWNPMRNLAAFVMLLDNLLSFTNINE